MKIAQRDEILRLLSLGDAIPLMREALVAQSRSECETPLPMHLYARDRDAEVHSNRAIAKAANFSWSRSRAAIRKTRAPVCPNTTD